jgi:glycosyltransferase involved in cell wall biosynthesis
MTQVLMIADKVESREARRKIVVLTADANTLVYHRGDLIRDFAKCGLEVVSSAAEDYPHVRSFLGELGGKHRAIRMVRSRVNPFADVMTWWDMWRLFREEKPEILFAYTIKSVVYGCVIAALAGVPQIVALLPGMGFTFVKPTTLKGRLLSWVSHALHRFALTIPQVVFVQNRDDLALIRELKLVPDETPIHVCAGSGVNVAEFPHVPLAGNADVAAGKVKFCLVSRLLISKGVRVFAGAARQVKARYPQAEFHLIGPFDPNPNRVTEEEVAGWVSEGLVVHHGMVRDVGALLGQMHVFCLPTWYREGVPHATLEALSMGRPVITTDSIGARECIAEPGVAAGEQGNRLGKNGVLCPPQSVGAVAEAMELYLKEPQRVAEHGLASRALAEEVFDVRKVNQRMLREMALEQV